MAGGAKCERFENWEPRWVVAEIGLMNGIERPGSTGRFKKWTAVD